MEPLATLVSFLSFVTLQLDLSIFCLKAIVSTHRNLLVSITLFLKSIYTDNEMVSKRYCLMLLTRKCVHTQRITPFSLRK